MNVLGRKVFDMMDLCGLYEIQFPDGKKYIGVTLTPFKRRWQLHRTGARKNGSQQLVCRAMRAFGVENVQFNPLVVSDDAHFLRCLEIAAIAVFGTLEPNGYNVEVGGNLSSMAVRRRIAEALRGRSLPSEANAKIQRKAIIVDGVLHQSFKAAGEAFGVHYAVARDRAKSLAWPTWTFADGTAKTVRCAGRPRGVKEIRPRAPGRWTVKG